MERNRNNTYFAKWCAPNTDFNKNRPHLQVTYFIHLSFLTFLATLPQPYLRMWFRLQVMVHHLEILKGWKFAFIRQWSIHQELKFARVLEESIASVDAHFHANSTNHPSNFAFKVGRVIYDVNIGMSYPGGCCIVIQLSG